MNNSSRRTRVQVLGALTLLAVLLLTGLGAARSRDTGFLNRTVKVAGVSYPYQVYVPADFYQQPKKKWPIVLFLHGAGERGADGLLQTAVGLPDAIRRHVERWPAVVVIPQCPADLYWTDPALQEMARAALAQEQHTYRTDNARVYLTGLSMGGYGAWLMASQHPTQFAAVVPICGGAYYPQTRAGQYPAQPAGLYETIAKGIGTKLPVWAFHGGSDLVVPVTESRQLVAALQAAGGQVRYTEYPEVGHESWIPAYADPALPEWLFQQHL